MTKLLLFGDSTAVEAARVLIMEAIDNREQKVKQRQKEYDKKKDVSCVLEFPSVCSDPC